MKVNHLILSLRPAKIFLSPRVLPDEGLLVDGIPVQGTFPPWPALPDILYDSTSRIFVGVCYQVPIEYRPQARYLCAVCDGSVFRYNDSSAKNKQKPYDFEDEEIHYFEIIWTAHIADKFALAQLTEGVWYRTEGGVFTAWGLTHVDEIVQEYNLLLPGTFSLPDLEVREV